MAAMAAMPLIKGLGATLGLANNAKRAVDILKELGNVPEEGYLLWRLLDATSPALELAVELACRHETLRYVESAVAMTQRTIQRCEQVLQREEEEGDERPEDAASWSTWFAVKKGGVERRVLVKTLCENLSMCQQALQLGLMAVQVEFGPCRTQAPFQLLPDVVEAAKTMLESFEMGRCDHQLLCVAQLWELAASSTRQAGADWSERGLFQCSLHLDAGRLTLQLVGLDEGPEEEGVEAVSDGLQGLSVHASGSAGLPDRQLLALDEGSCFERSTLGAIVGEECLSSRRDSAALAYKVSGGAADASATPRSRALSTALRFLPAGSGVSAEVCETVVAFCRMKGGSLDSPHLSAVFDGGEATTAELLRQLRAGTGEYEADGDQTPASRTPGFASTPVSKSVGGRG